MTTKTIALLIGGEPSNDSAPPLLSFGEIAALPSQVDRLRQFIARLAEVERAESTATYRTDRQRRRGARIRRDIAERKRQLLARLAAAESEERNTTEAEESATATERCREVAEREGNLAHQDRTEKLR